MIETPTPQDVEDAARLAGLSIGALCREVGIDASSYWRWRSGHTSIRIETVRRMQEVIERRAGKQP